MQIILLPKPTTQIPSDYLSKIRHEIQFLRQHCHFSDEKELANLVLHYLMSENRLGVPQAFLKVHCKIAHKSYELKLESYLQKTEKTSFGWADILLVNKSCGVYRLRIAPHTSIATHIHRRTQEKECALSDGLLLQGKALKAGEIRIWPLNFPHRYDNRTSLEQSILCIDEPAFDPNDEIFVNINVDKLEDLGEENSQAFSTNQQEGFYDLDLSIDQ